MQVIDLLNSHSVCSLGFPFLFSSLLSYNLLLHPSPPNIPIVKPSFFFSPIRTNYYTSENAVVSVL